MQRRRPFLCRRAHAFTLVEVLVVLAIIGLIVGSLGWGGAFQTRSQRASVEDVLWDAMREARERALFSGVDVDLAIETTDRAAPAFVARARGVELARHPFQPGRTGPGVRFLTAEPPGAAAAFSSAIERPRLVFFADGTCVPFRIEFLDTNPIRMVRVDPWTCAPVLPSPDPRR